MRRRSFKQAMTVSGAAALAAASLAGCTAQPPDGSESSPEPESGAPSATVPAEDLSWILEEQEDDSFAGAATAGGGGSMRHSLDFENVPKGTATVEVHVFCAPVSATAVLTVEGDTTDIECTGPEQSQVVEVNADEARESRYISAEIEPDESPREFSYAMVVKAG
ncbi:hypothetical protein [Zhihengliuella salsuginis]|uniref:hypothetical protein n=1 Tax=Zhihengliuella salsuginis TaxID=578222 RepID=UPI001679D59B|nr:hypothetical protein [Zhihengliuella salsuginis]